MGIDPVAISDPDTSKASAVYRHATPPLCIGRSTDRSVSMLEYVSCEMERTQLNASSEMRLQSRAAEIVEYLNDPSN
jgi:hypothetical protein